MQLVKYLLTFVFIASTSLASASERVCDSKVLEIPKSHWLFNESKEIQKKTLLYLSLNNYYQCKRNKLKEEVFSRIEKISTTGSKDELQEYIDSIVDIFPDKAIRAEITKKIGNEKLDELLEDYSQSFDIFTTLEILGLAEHSKQPD
ncbi:hypothetical protein [Endozoicomonas arenosclerae]|uniref:hypothetical protein n=1 Tax=Endozoicomonas arenosclerae TaxID=1633495 RepID=UPI000784BB73|nr:hypothetical protein [Endozoicomonas arenosclerae]